MKRILLLVLLLLVLPALMLTAWLTGTRSGLAWTLSQLESDQLSIELSGLNGSLFYGLDADQMLLVVDGSQVRLTGVSARWTLQLLPFEMDFSNVSAATVEVTPKNDTSATDSHSSTPEPMPAPFPLRVQELSVGSFLWAGEDPVQLQQLALSGQWLGQQLTIDRLQWAAPFPVHLSGSVDTLNYGHQLDLEANPEGTRWSSQLAGNLDQSRLLVTAPALGLEVNGTLSELWQAPRYALSVQWSGDPALTADFDVQGSTEQGRASGQFIVDGYPILVETLEILRQSDGVQLSESRILIPHLDLELTAAGSIFSNGQARLDGSWSRAAAGTEAMTGEFQWSGQPDQYRLQITSATGPLRGVVKALGNRESLELEQAVFAQGQGQVVAAGHIRWNPQVTAHLDGTLERFDPSMIWADAPGTVDAGFNLDIRQSDAGYHSELTISDLVGELRGRRVDGSGQLMLKDVRPISAQLDLVSGSSRLTLLAPDLDSQPAVIAMDVQDLGDLIPGALGTLTGQFEIMDPAAMTGISGTLEALNLQFGEWQAERLSAALESDTNDLPVGTINGHGVILGGYELGHIELRTQGLLQQLEFALEVDSQLGRLKSSGQLNGPDELRLDEWVMNSPDHGVWSLQQAIEIDLSGAMPAPAESACLVNDSAQACLAPTAIPGRLRLYSKHFSLALLSPLLRVASGSSLNLDGQMEGDIEFALDQGRLVSLEGQLSGGATRIWWQDRLSEPVDLDNWLIQADGSGPIDLTVQANGPMGLIQVQGQISPGAEQTGLDLLAQVSLPSLTGLIAAGTGSPNVKGQLNGEVRVTGSSAAPVMAGSLQVTRLSFPVERFGGRLDDGQARIDFSPDGQVSLAGSGVLGNGSVTISGKGHMPADGSAVTGTLGIQARQADLANSPELKLQANADLELDLNAKRLALGGQVELLDAMVRMGPLEMTASVSPDVEFVHDPENGAPSPYDLPIVTAINLSAVKPVRVSGYGLDAAVTGKLKITDAPDRPTLARGNLNVTGTYRVYGQELEIATGNLAYAATPLDDPLLKLEAIREVVAGEVGVRVTGNAQQPNIQLFSNPPMNEADILAYLIFGRTMNDGSMADKTEVSAAILGLRASGFNPSSTIAGLQIDLDVSQDVGGAAFSVGRFLSPRLYLRYTIGLLEQLDQLALRYQLGRGWTIQTQIGEEVQASLKYRVERARTTPPTTNKQ